VVSVRQEVVEIKGDKDDLATVNEQNPPNLTGVVLLD